MKPKLIAVLTAALALSTAATGPAAAQEHNGHGAGEKPRGCTLCQPWIYAEGAALYRTDEALPAAASERWTPLTRVVVEIGTPTRHLGFFTHLEVNPVDGGTPTLAYGGQLWLLPRFSRFNLTGGVGLIHRRNGIGETRPGAFQVRGWGHVGAELMTPIHEVTLYAQAGTAFSGESKISYQFGLRHPIAPWRAHLF